MFVAVQAKALAHSSVSSCGARRGRLEVDPYRMAVVCVLCSQLDHGLAQQAGTWVRVRAGQQGRKTPKDIAHEAVSLFGLKPCVGALHQRCLGQSEQKPVFQVE